MSTTNENPAEVAETPPNPRPTRRGILIASGLLLVGAAAGGYALYRHYHKPEAGGGPSNPGQALTKAVRDVPPIRFTDVTSAAGIHFRHVNGQTPEKLLPETMGSGVAVFDYDGDGKPDILFVNSCPWPGHGNPAADTPPATMKLYRNLGGWKFEDVTHAAGLDKVMYGMGVAVGDIDNDGRPDVFVSCVGKHCLFRNTDGKRFEDVTDAAGVGGPGPDLQSLPRDNFMGHKAPIPFGSSATFLDYDGDGRLDLFACHYVSWSPGIDLSISTTLTGGGRTYQQPQNMEGAQCVLYRNIDGKKFEDVSAKAGVRVTEKEGTDANARVRAVGKSLGVIACDPDNDGWPDLLVANDTVRNFFFHNEPGPDGGRVFREDGFRTGAAYAAEGKARGAMGIDWGEFAPGRCAAIIANFADEPITCLEKHPSRLLFSDTAMTTGVGGPSRQPLKFGTFFFDYDNDGRLDLLIANGHIDPDIKKIQARQEYAQPPQLFWNTGDSECYFEPATAKQAGDDLFKPMVGRGSAFADLDGDGDLDVILAANGGEARVLRNDAPKTNHWVRLDLRGDGVKSNKSAIGATVAVEAGGKTFARQITSGRGYLSQSELVLTIGLGPATKIDKVTVRWPGKNGGTETRTHLDTDKVYVLEQGKAK